MSRQIETAPPKGGPVTIATRGSRLALWQAHHVKQRLFSGGNGTLAELKVIKTQGDRNQKDPLSSIGGKGVFVREIEKELLAKRADLAVHSLKDLPVKSPQELSLKALLPRDPAGDILILKRQPRDLPKGPLSAEFFQSLGAIRVATGSLRRTALMKEANSKVKVFPLRGNVDTRINRLYDEDNWDAIILAEASISRLNLQDSLTYRRLDPTWFTPSPAQGVLAVQCHRLNPLASTLNKLDCPETRFAACLERKILEFLGGDCTLPIGVHASTTKSSHAEVRATVLNEKGQSVRATCHFEGNPSYEDAAQKTVNTLIANGVNRILKDLGLPMVEPKELSFNRQETHPS